MVERTPIRMYGHGQAPIAVLIKCLGCEALVKRDTLTKPDKLEHRSIKCIFVGYPKETIGYSFFYPPENKIFVAWNAEFLENSLINHEAKDDQEIDEPQSDSNPIRRSTRTRRAPDQMCLYVDAEEHELRDLDAIHENKPTNTKVWELVDLPPNGKTVGHKWLFKKKTDMDGAVHTYKARLVAKGFTQTSDWIMKQETFLLLQDHLEANGSYSIAALYDFEIWQMVDKTAFTQWISQ
ncbi:retrotransposon protein, putative, ty1-copia subclass [Tanacetum coccineum]